MRTKRAYMYVHMAIREFSHFHSHSEHQILFSGFQIIFAFFGRRNVMERGAQFRRNISFHYCRSSVASLQKIATRLYACYLNEIP